MKTKLAISIATLTAELPLQPTADGWVQLLPAGQTKARDGRPFNVEGGHWVLTAEVAERLIAQTQLAQQGNDLVIDYEHQTLHSEKNGKPAPAAGWFSSTDIEWREGQGLYIKPRWTERAQAHLAAVEYKYISAVFPYNADGEPLLLRMAALTNDPGVTGMDALAALAARKFVDPQPNQPEPVMNEALRKLLEQLGINLSDDANDLTDEQWQAALTAMKTLQKTASTNAEKVTQLTDQVAALKANSDETNLADFVPAATYNAVLSELAILKAGSDETSVSNLLEAAQAEGKVMAAELDYLTQFADQQGVAALKGMLDVRPAVAALKGQQTTQTKPPEADQNSLSDAELAICKACGIAPEEYLKQK